MDYKNEIIRRDKRIESYKKDILALNEEIIALKQLLDCAAANISLLVKKQGGSCKISRSDVSKALGQYRLKARNDGEGNYLLELVEDSTDKEVSQ